MADYRIICILRRSDGRPRAVGYSQNGNGVMYDGVWTLEQARSAIEDGHRLYIVSPSAAAEADLELTEGGIRAKPRQGGDNDLLDLHDLPECGGCRDEETLTALGD